MKQWIFLTALFAVFLPASGQSPLTKAEFEFARDADDSSFIRAFIARCDTLSVMFAGNRLVPARPVLEKQKTPAYRLVWHPDFSALDPVGQFGFTTGPYEARRLTDDSLIFCGHYSTIWHRNEKNEWKLIIDFGVTYPESLYGRPNVLEWRGTGGPDTTMATYQAIEKAFIEDLPVRGMDSYLKYSKEETWFNQQGQHPFTGKNLAAAKDSLNWSGLQFDPEAGLMAPCRDFAYAFGSWKKDGKAGHYLRVWMHGEDGWKIMLQVLV